MKTRIYLLLLVSFPLLIIAQPETYNWYFGNQYGLNFSSGIPEEITDSAIRTFEGCAAVSDAEGNILFYTNGGGRDPATGQAPGTIWNRNNEVMYDMSFTEGGGWSSAQSSLIIPKPGQDSVYYLFTMEEAESNMGDGIPDQPLGRGLSYFEVDMRLNGALGGVTVADQRLYVPSYEGLTGTIHADGERYWILFTDGDESNTIFLRLLVDDTAVEATNIDSVVVENVVFLGGTTKISPDGKWIACAGQLFSFNNETGEISLSSITLQTIFSGGTFSPESRYYYFWQGFDELVRVDLLADDIEASREILPINFSNRLPGQMQMASNGNIYFVTVDLFDLTTSISEISCPGSMNPTINADLFEYTSIEEEPFFIGLPNFTDHLFSIPLAGETLEPEELSFCPNESIELDARRSGQTYLWSTGETEASIQVSAPGTYTVTITINDCGGMIIDEKSVIEASPPTIAFGETPPLNSLCLDTDNEIMIITEGENTIEWSTGNTENTIVLTGPISTPLAVTVSNECSTITQELDLEFIDCTLPDCELVFPDIISPNGDGVNDLFGGFRNCPPSSYELRVYNRWGNLVFESNSIDNTWDGRFNGNVAPSDIYLYHAQYRFAETEDVQTASGQLTVVR